MNNRQQRDLLFNQNRGLVHKVARLYNRRTLPLDDIIQEGYLGLLRAAEKFDPSMGNKFSTYACWWIRAYIARAIRQDRVTKVPDWAQIQRGIAFKTMLTRRYENAGEWPGVDEVIDELRPVGSRKTTRQILQGSFKETSMDEDIGKCDEGGHRNLYDLIVDEAAPNPEAVASARQQITEIASRVDGLPERQRMVIKARLGLQDGRAETLQSIGDRCGLSRERVRQIEQKALRELGIRRRKTRKAG